MNRILITGASSGFGLETARLFLDRGWSVVATMRTPREGLLPASERLTILPLDVTDAASIAHAVDAAGPLDALVNNAGIGLLNALEGTSLEIIREVFETNTLGTIAMTRAVLPQLRERGAGVVVNVTSSVTLKSLPLLSVYTASKAAVNAFTQALVQEVEPFGVRARLVLPGRAPDTSFAENARERMAAGFPQAYAETAQAVFQGWQTTDEFTRPGDVAEAVWHVVTDPDAPVVTPAGADAVTWLREAREGHSELS
jgi:NAD(P)-dependent dehydrogenase (short-subunit alcohol dehydrogenase family)